MICVSIQEQDFRQCRQILENCRMAEIRGDLCKFTVAQTEQLAASHPNLLITCRIENSSREYAYETITRAIVKGARYADVEIEAPCDHLEYIKTYARANGCKLIISYHNFRGTNSLDELEQIYDLCLRKGADIVKIVTTAHTISDAVRTLSLYRSETYKKAGKGTLIAFAMGEAGKFTRHLCVTMGAPYTYAACDNGAATAPGQYTSAEMEALLDTGYQADTTGSHAFSKNLFPALPDTVTIPCSKSVAQRAVLAAALAAGESTLENYAPCNDIEGALKAVQTLGCRIRKSGDTLLIHSAGAAMLRNLTRLETGESGLLTRLLLPLAGYISGTGGKTVEITGHGSLLKRNLAESARALEAAGLQCRTDGYLPFKISGKITNTHPEISGKESSQIVSGFLMTLPLLSHDTTLTVTRPGSLPYIELTLKTLKAFGIHIQETGATADKITYHIPGRQTYTPARIYMDADWSSAAYFAVAGALGKGITLQDMPLNSSQADEAILDILKLCGAGVTIRPGTGTRADITIQAAPLHAFTWDATHCPDLFPILTVLASHCTGTSVIKGVNRLMQKESNRAETIFTEFTKLGAEINILDDEMYITGTPLHGGKVKGHNDHRIAMSLIIAGLFTGEPVIPDDIKCIGKSFPSFINKLTRKK